MKHFYAGVILSFGRVAIIIHSAGRSVTRGQIVLLNMTTPATVESPYVPHQRISTPITRFQIAEKGGTWFHKNTLDKNTCLIYTLRDKRTLGILTYLATCTECGTHPRVQE